MPAPDSAPARGDSAYWDRVYAGGDRQRGWYQEHATVSLALIEQFGTSLPPWPRRSVIDVGGGAGTLVDDVLARGCRDVTALDLSAGGMAIARDRLAEQARQVTWLVADVTRWTPSRSYDVWHDRAVLHFLLSDEDRGAYRRRLLAGTAPGSLVVIGGFGPEAPATCSRLPVRQLTPDDLSTLLEPECSLVDSRFDRFRTPAGEDRQYLWTTAVRRAPALA